MNSEINQSRFQSIYQMLLEMGGGNFTHRIQRSKEDDELEILIVMVNMLAEEINGSISHRGYVNPHQSYKYLVQTTFILDEKFVIKSFNSDVPILLGYSAESLCNDLFESILSEESISVWNSIQNQLSQDSTFQTTLQLSYVTKEQLLVPSFCTVSRLLQSSEILVSSVTSVQQESIPINETLFPNKNTGKDLATRRSDAQLLQKLYDYILNNLDTPLPSINELSRIFGTNQYKLKEGFQYFFKTGIYQFYNDERLKKAHLMIQQTPMSLKTIAQVCGFGSYPNFSKAFKKKYHYAPNETKRMQ